MNSMESYELMKLLIPEKKVNDVAKFMRMNPSLLYQERRKAGTDLTDTGTRNTIDRLDLMCEWNLDRDAELVRIVGERYLTMYQNHINPPEDNVSVDDLLRILGEASRECGEAISALAGRRSIKDCTVEVHQAKKILEKALAMVCRMERE